MAKKQVFDKKKVAKKKEDYNFFGTRKEMVVKEIMDKDVVVKVVAKDEKGLYFTIPENVGTGFADPNRYGADRSKLTGYEEEFLKEEAKEE